LFGLKKEEEEGDSRRKKRKRLFGNPKSAFLLLLRCCWIASNEAKRHATSRRGKFQSKTKVEIHETLNCFNQIG
jgi:hypothetical protein